MSNECGWKWHLTDVMSQDDEAELIRAAKAGDYWSAAKLVHGNLKLVLFMASAYARSSADRDDLVGAGLLGAWIAANRYDPSRGMKFCTYAAWWIRSSMMQHTKQSCRLLSDFPNMTHFKRELCRQYAMSGKGAWDDSVRVAVQDRLDMNSAKLDELLDASRSYATSMDAPVGQDGEETLGDRIRNYDADPEEQCIAKENRDFAQLWLRSAMASLTDREATVIRSIMSSESLAEAGKKIGVTKQRAKQIGDRAALKMRRCILQYQADCRETRSSCSQHN
jgi:RNA polymerase sigma factor (sigma-70 family)